MSKKPSYRDAKDLVESALSLRYFYPDDVIDGQTAIPVHAEDGEGKLVLALGENASGKSFFRRIIQLLCAEAEVECMGLSMAGRKSGITSLFIYGDEGRQSTGVNSGHTVTTGINTCRGRTTPHVIYWDEPDIGLSDGWAAAMGHEIAEFAKDPPEHTLAIFVTSHSRALVRELARISPHYVHFGDKNPPKTLDRWLSREPVVRPFNELYEAARERHRLIQCIINDVKSQKE